VPCAAPPKGASAKVRSVRPLAGFLERPWFDALYFRGTRHGQPTSRDNQSSGARPSLPAPLSAAEWDMVVEALTLTPRQASIVALILRGRRDKQIAAELEIRLPTVRSHLRHLFALLGVADRVELVLRVFRRSARERMNGIVIF